MSLMTDATVAGTTLTQGLVNAKSAAATASTASTTAGTSTSASDETTISSSDFLTLLVTEMKNQDPTQPTDPNAYIQQLVGVNSLQQLISINSELGTATAATTTADTGVGSVTAS